MPAYVGRDEDSSANLLPWQYSRPGQLRAEYLVDDALRAASVPIEEVLALRPFKPQRVNPPRYGYRQEELGIRDVLNTDQWAPQFRSWVSGAPQSAFVDDDAYMSAGLRNYLGGANP